MSTATLPALLTDHEAAEYLGVSVGTLSVWRSVGRYQIPYLKVGRKIRYRQCDLEAWLRTREATHTGENPARVPDAARV